MEGIWLVSYLVLWIFVLLQTALFIALLRHVGNLRLWLKQAGVIREHVTYEEGPSIGEKIEKLLDTLTDSILLLGHENLKAKLLMFVPAGFFGCDDLLPALKKFEELYCEILQILIVSFEPAVEEQFEVVRRSGIKAPIITKYGMKISQLCNIHTAPYALIVDEEYKACAKLPVGDFQGLESILQEYQSR